MTEKRFYIDNDGDLYDRQTNRLLMLDFGYSNAIHVNSVLECLNNLHEESEDLKKKEVELGQNYLKYLEENNRLQKENDELKQQLRTNYIVNKQYEENQRLIKMLDNVANHMQREHRDMPIDEFVYWWNKIATEGLD